MLILLLEDRPDREASTFAEEDLTRMTGFTRGELARAYTALKVPHQFKVGEDDAHPWMSWRTRILGR